MPPLLVAPHSHFDTEWTDDFEGSLRSQLPQMAERLDLLAEDPRHVFCLDEELVVRLFVERRPEYTDALRRAVLEGKAEPKGMVAQVDVGLCLGETIVRHFVYGRQWMESLIGVEPGSLDIRVAHTLDNYNLVAQYPQILKQCGRDFLVIGRYPTTVYHVRPPTTDLDMWWEGAEGSRVLTHYDRDYGGIGPKPEYEPSKAVALDILSKSPGPAAFAFSGADFSPADPELPAKLASWSGRDGYPEARLAVPSEFFDAIAGCDALRTVSIDAWTDHDGGYESHVDARQLQRRTEEMALTAETLCTVAARLGHPYPGETLYAAWYQLMLSTHHDPQLTVLCDPFLRDGMTRLHQAIGGFKGAMDSALKFFADRTSEPGSVVYNPLAWTRTDVIEVAREKTIVMDRGGETQKVMESAPFVIEQAPAFGFKVVNMDETSASAGDTIELVAEPLGLTEYRRNGKTLLSRDAGYVIGEIVVTADPGCMAVIRDEGDPLDGWQNETPVHETLEGVGSRVTLKRRFRSTLVTQTITAYHQFDRLDVRIVFDVKDVALRYRMAVPGAPGSRYWVEEPFAALQRPADGTVRNTGCWAALIKGPRAVAVINRTGTPCVSADSQVLMQSLLRACDMDNLERRPEWPERDKDCNWCMPDLPNHMAKELGPHTLDFAIVAGDQTIADIHRAAREFNMPLVPGPKTAGAGDVLPSTSPLAVENAFVSAYKRAEREDAEIIRLYNPTPESMEAGINTAPGTWEFNDVNMDEFPLAEPEMIEDAWHRTLKPYQILTLMMKPATRKPAS